MPVTYATRSLVNTVLICCLPHDWIECHDPSRTRYSAVNIITNESSVVR